MILTIDVGNTDTVFDVYKNNVLINSYRRPTESNVNHKVYCDFLKSINKDSIDGVIISCVVPGIKRLVEYACQDIFRVKPLIVGDEGLRIDLTIKIDIPKSLGADRIANSVAAISKYKGRVIVVDFGTATTFGIIGKDKDYLGGAIMPGVNSAIKGLHTSAAMLPSYSIKKPKKAIATCLEDGLHSGIFFGTLGAVSFMLKKMKQELAEDYMIVATGGLGRFFEGYKEVIDVYDEHLTTFGLLQIYNFNK